MPIDLFIILMMNVHCTSSINIGVRRTLVSREVVPSSVLSVLSMSYSQFIHCRHRRRGPFTENSITQCFETIYEKIPQTPINIWICITSISKNNYIRQKSIFVVDNL